MTPKTLTASISLALLAAAHGGPLSAQASLGQAISHALSKEAQTIKQGESQAARENPPAPAKPTDTIARHSTGRPAARGNAVEAPLGTGDALANTDATTCRQSNGTTIRVSGGYRPAAEDSGECR